MFRYIHGGKKQKTSDKREIMMKLNTFFKLLYQISAHLVEEQNEVDGERHEQSQESQVVEVSGQIILKTELCLVPEVISSV